MQTHGLHKLHTKQAGAPEALAQYELPRGELHLGDPQWQQSLQDAFDPFRVTQ